MKFVVIALSAASTVMNVGALFAALTFLIISAKTLLFTQNPFKKEDEKF
jgi:hypothetical protein